MDGDGVNGARSDIGAFEYQRKPPIAAFTAPTSLAPGVIGQFSSAPSGDPDAGDKAGFKYSWSFGDGALSRRLTGSRVRHRGRIRSDPQGDRSHRPQRYAHRPGERRCARPARRSAGSAATAGPAAAAGPAEPPGPPEPTERRGGSADLRCGGQGRPRRLVRFRLSEDAVVVLRFKRKGARRGKGLTVRGKAGVNRVRFLRRLALRAGSYAIAIRATDAAGNATTQKAAARFVLRAALSLGSTERLRGSRF